MILPDASTRHAIPGMGTIGNHAMCDASFLNKKRINHGTTVLLLDDRTMKFTHVSTLSTPSLPAKEILAHAYN